MSPVNARCRVCGCENFVALAQRSDGVRVIRCANCTMGVIDPIPNDLLAFYGDDYYHGQPDGKGCPDQGYSNYAYTSEHGVAWAAALVKLLCPAGGDVLDIGCADGHLLAKLGPNYTLSGIEANEATGRIAAARGIDVLGRDVADSTLIERNHGRFDIITAIAVFEHLRDIRSGMEAGLRLLRDDGVLVFEVPLMSTVHDNAAWLTSSLEHVWYPSELGLRYLIQTELGAQLVGRELYVAGYASTYVGLVFRDKADGQAVRGLATRVLMREADPASSEEAMARMLLHLVHAAAPTPADVGALAKLDTAVLNPSLMQRFSALWQSDLHRLETAQSQAELGERRLQAELVAVRSDQMRNQIELTASLTTAQAQLAIVQADFAAHVAAAVDLSRWQQALGRDRAAADAVLAHAESIRSSPIWAVVSHLSAAAERYPRLSRLARRSARVLWWTMRGQLISRLRLRRQYRAELRNPLSLSTQPSQLLRATTPTNDVSDHASAELEAAPVLLDETGHRPSLAASSASSEGWPLVSVVITSFNYGKFVAAAVDSALDQTFKDLEVIVVEGGSSDSVSRFTAAGLQRPRMRLLMQGTGHRPGANRNFGISQARGRYVCCLDADDTLAPTYIEKAVFLLERHGYDVVSGAMAKVGAEFGQLNILEQPDLEAILGGNHVLTCAVFRRSFWEQAGGYRDVVAEVAGHVHEDWAFWIRLAALGARFRNLHHDPVLRYRVHASSLSRGENVLSMDKQRKMVRAMNNDVLQPLDSKIAWSKKRASIRYGTPSAPPTPIILDRAPSDTKRTLLLAMPYLIMGGAERLLSAVVGHLVSVGWRVVIVTTLEADFEHGDTTPWFERYTSEIFHLPRCLPAELWEDFVHQLVRSRAVGIIWVVGSTLMYNCLRDLRTANPQVRVADLLFNTIGHTANNRRRRDLIDLIFVESDEVRQWLLARGEGANRIRLVESGVDLVALHPMPRAETLLQQTGATPDDLIVGYSGRWSEEKNPLGFIAIARLVDSALPVRFVMTGTGPLRTAVEHAIREAGFPNGRFTLLGQVSEVAPVLASFDLLVIPSVLDGRPMVALEALSMGVPILASRVGGLPELISEPWGWLCEPNDLEAFARHVENAARDQPALKEMRRQARIHAEAKLDVQSMFASYAAGLEALLPKSRLGGRDSDDIPAVRVDPAAIQRLIDDAAGELTANGLTQ